MVFLLQTTFSSEFSSGLIFSLQSQAMCCGSSFLNNCTAFNDYFSAAFEPISNCNFSLFEPLLSITNLFCENLLRSFSSLSWDLLNRSILIKVVHVSFRKSFCKMSVHESLFSYLLNFIYQHFFIKPR